MGVAAWVREIAGSHDPRISQTTPVVPLQTHGLPTRPIAPETAQVFVCGGVVVKVHAADTDPRLLTARLAAMGGPDTEPVWVQPLWYRVFDSPSGAPATLWPRVTVLSTIEVPPWGPAGALLARLHRAPVSGTPPRHGGHARLARALRRIADHNELGWLLERGREVAAQLTTAPQQQWVHGDFHLGQLGHTVLRRSWKLLDVDDFGIGDPAWDLARPAGFWAAGLLGDEAWQEFLDGYRSAKGPALPAQGDPWPVLDLPARAAVIIATAQALRHPDGADTAEALLAACQRMR